ncbi:MAG: protoporphyrinogen oxidase HemJ [Alphaproteobacteria bacterium]|nr:MAG: protoporphyrinogen oxidase HemJ [Alphaproteobacteria bacterium]TAF15186.1 MAG: protoporphyrinogen oxidase HemJ [Alphaproteobacteria bacterium]TAF41497.1 MAG: protoporphyrinogen oxidase HemJ [Alphaproteobacteria bacterium]TAF77021.1 MAG: protoporphyrinogen oxidase HemJ [Alphaproteobacteria bacterium]
MDQETLYATLKTLHIIALISWMAGLLYLPRLYVYHAGVAVGSESDAMLQVMERKLLRFIMNPAMIATWVFGLWLAIAFDFFAFGWMHTKMTLVLLMSGIHGMLAMHRKQFASGNNQRSARYFRWLNEAPTVLMIIIVVLVIYKPF